MDDLRPAKRPKISAKSRVFQHGSTAKTSKSNKGKGKQAAQSRNAGKLAALMSITLDIFFEIITHLSPVDLLHLCRVSKHFRTTFMSKSVRSLWIAARKNADVLPAPEPLPGMSEPCFAALLFENNCSACGAGRASKVDYALGFRFCAACAKTNLQEGRALLKRHHNPPDLVLSLLPMAADAVEGETLAVTRAVSLCYVTEFEDVVSRYKELSRNENDKEALDEFVARRREYVASVAKHAQAITAWTVECRRISAKQLDEVQQRRVASIKERLVSLGYVENDFPTLSDEDCMGTDAWNSIVEQPRELTERVWKTIQGKLVEAIEDCKVSRSATLLMLQKIQRQGELRRRYTEWIQGMAVDDGPYPLFPELRSLPQVAAMVNEDNLQTEIDQRRFDEIVLPIMQQYRTSTRLEMVKALRLATSKSGEASNGDTGDGSSEDILYNATSLFANPHDVASRYRSSFYLTEGTIPDVFSFKELLRELRGVYVRGSIFDGLEKALYEPEPVAVEIARAVLKSVGLPEDTPYAEVDGRVVCLCHKTDFAQPASFSGLINHIHQEQSHCQMIMGVLRENRRACKDTDEYDYFNDHDFEGSSFLQLLRTDETYVAPNNAGDVSEDESELFGRCRICVAIASLALQNIDGFCQWLSLQQLMPVRVVRRHMLAKHKREFDENDAVSMSPSMSDTNVWDFNL